MKKLAILAPALAMLALTASPALARSTGVNVDGRTYVFREDDDGATEGAARYEIDGKTFLVGEDEVIVQQPGQPDLHIPLEKEACADAIATDEAQGGTAERVSEVTVIAGDDPAGVFFIQKGEAIAQEGALADAEQGDDNQDWGAEYAAFEPYGLRRDAGTGKLYYLGTPVRVFEDARSVDGGTAELSYFDPDGAVDLRTIRDAKGELTGLEALSPAEFAARDLSQWTNPDPPRMESVATSGAEPTPEERAAFFAPYAPFGLRYDPEQDRLYIDGRPVRNFLDIRQSNGESPTSGKFQGSLTQLQFDGEVDVTILRDYNHPTENGEGKLTGLEVSEAK